MTDASFFDEATEQSQVKSTIVAKYFWAWAKVIGSRPGSNKIAYFDLFSGPGHYDNGQDSTPLRVLRKAIDDPSLREKLVFRFNDAYSEYARLLRQAIDSLPDLDRLHHRPQVTNMVVGGDLSRKIGRLRRIPTLLFADPWGYKGLSIQLIRAFVKDNWGCECIFFFNYNRINPGINNESVREHMNDLFGEHRAEELRRELCGLSPTERELAIVEAISQALKEDIGGYVLTFRFKTASGRRTSHHLIFVTRHSRGYEIMKEIMATESSESTQGVASFEYSPASRRQPFLFQLSRPLDDLADMLLETFAGQTLKMVEIYKRHHVGTPYTKRNYKAILASLENQGIIVANPPAEKRVIRKGQRTFADSVLVRFPEFG